MGSMVEPVSPSTAASLVGLWPTASAPSSLGEPLEHAAQRGAQDGGVLALQVGIGRAQGVQIAAAGALVGRAPAILHAGAQPGLDHRSAWHRLAQRACEAGQRLRRPLRAARPSSS
jgi:hypothetical protein